MSMKTLFLVLGMLPFSVQAANLESCKFSSIQPEAKRSAVYSEFGKPDRVIGDHLSIDVYNVTEGSEVWVTWMGTGESERLLYVQHIGADLDTPLPCK